MPNLSPDASAYAGAAQAPSTARAYAAAWKLWAAYAVEHELEAIPAAPEAVANWLADRARSGRAISSIRKDVAAVRAKHLEQDLSFDTRSPAITKVLRGISRTEAREQRQVEPLRSADLTAMLEAVDNDNASALRDAAVLALGFLFALRRSEIATLDFDTLGSGDGILKISSREAAFIQVRGKTVKGGEALRVTIPRRDSDGKPVAPVAFAVIEQWLAHAMIAPGTPVIRAVHRSGFVFDNGLVGDTIAPIIKRRVQEYLQSKGTPPALAKTEAARYSGHSLRVGFATSAAELGVDALSIQRHGRWANGEMVARYTKSADAARTSPFLKGVGG